LEIEKFKKIIDGLFSFRQGEPWGRKIRNPKHEIRNKFEIQNQKFKTVGRRRFLKFWIFFLSDFGFVSNFELRISDFPPPTTPHPSAGIILEMPEAKDTLEQYYLEMRWRCLSLAADLDRIERGANGPAVLDSDPRLAKLRQALGVLLEGHGNRAEQVQSIFSDKTPPPPYSRK